MKGKKCLFVMDGWEDLAPPVLVSFFLRSIVQGNAHEVSFTMVLFFVTSRPIASSSLVSCISSTINVEAFSADDVISYTTQYFSKQEEAQKFLSSMKVLLLPVSSTISVKAFSADGIICPLSSVKVPSH